MRSSLAGAMLGAALGVCACTPPAGFACTTDDECSLAGTPGVCQPDGNCSYPDDNCASGFRYPSGASDGAGGECVPGTAAGDSSGGPPTVSGATDSRGGTTSGSDGPGESSSTTAPAPGTSDSGTSTTGFFCFDDIYEDGVTSEIPTNGCSTAPPDMPLQASLQDEIDFDEFEITLDASCTGTLLPSAQIDADVPMRVCMYLACGMTQPAVECTTGTQATNDEDVPGCCSEVEQDPSVLVSDYACSEAVTAVVAVFDGPPECSGYWLTYGSEA